MLNDMAYLNYKAFEIYVYVDLLKRILQVFVISMCRLLTPMPLSKKKASLSSQNLFLKKKFTSIFESVYLI